MSNYHIHLIFLERQLLEKSIEKIVTRNMYFIEKRKHIRTKKEFLDENGKIRHGCKTILKCQAYERHFFEPKIGHYKDKEFQDEAKHNLMNFINQYVKDKDK